MVRHTGSCHCGKIRFAVHADIARVRVCARTAPQLWSVNARCLDGIDLDALEIERVSGSRLP